MKALEVLKKDPFCHNYMSSRKISKVELFLFSILLILLAICNSNMVLISSGRNYFGPLITFVVQMLLISLIYIKRNALCPHLKDSNHKYINYFLLYTYLMTIAGLFVADCYLEYRQLFIGFISLNLPILAWLFYKPTVTISILSFWYKYSWIPFFLLFYNKIGFVQMYWQPILILLCLFPLFKPRYVILILIISFLYATIDIEGQRAPFIKAIVALITGIGVGIRKIISDKLIRIAHILAYLSVIYLFVYIFSDFFVVVTGKAEAQDVVTNNFEREEILQDTRSLLYIDVLNSSISNGYFIWGHTPARGFEVEYSERLFMRENTIMTKNERHMNEMVLSNVYTWEGLIGLILYSLIYMYGSYLAVYHSKNRIIPFLGCFIAWRWAWGWVEDVNLFLCTDIDLWVLISICYSSYYREMKDSEFKLWASGLLSANSKKKFLSFFSKGKYE